MAEAFKQRTDWAEYVIEMLASQPLVSECVYRSPKYLDKAIEKEVVDLILKLADRAMLVSIKCQQRPGERSPEKEALWTIKSAASALRQIKGALRTLNSDDCWCDHPRRGEVRISKAELTPAHGIVLVEATQPIALPDELPLSLDSIPISYFSVNDFCNIVQELRTYPEIETYLEARRTIPMDALRSVGREQALYQFYLLNGESFAGCLGPDDAQIVCNARADQLVAAMASKREADNYARLLERVADSLADRHPQYEEGLSEEQLKYFDPAGARMNYLKLQGELCDLRLAERAVLGRQLEGLIEKAQHAKPPAMTYASARFDSKPDLVCVLGSSYGHPRPRVIEWALNLARGAMAYYDKHRAMVIVDRDSVSFEIVMLGEAHHSIAAFHFGEQVFGNLRIDHIPQTLVPQAGKS